MKKLPPNAKGKKEQDISISISIYKFSFYGLRCHKTLIKTANSDNLMFIALSNQAGLSHA